MMRFARKRMKVAARFDFAADAEDAVQNAFYKLVRYIHRIDFDRDEREIRVYVMTVLANEIAAILAPTPVTPLTDEYVKFVSEEEFYRKLTENETSECLERALKKLDPKLTVVLVMRYVEEKSAESIAEMLEISKKTVYRRLEQAKTTLLKLLQEVKV